MLSERDLAALPNSLQDHFKRLKRDLIDRICNRIGEIGSVYTASTSKLKTEEDLQEAVKNAQSGLKVEETQPYKELQKKYETLSASAVDESGKTYKELHAALKGDFDTYKATVETEKTERETDDKIIAVQSKHQYANDRTGKSLLDDIKKILKDPENKKSIEEIHTELTMDKEGKPIPGIFAKAPDMPPSGGVGGEDKPKYIPPKVL